VAEKMIFHSAGNARLFLLGHRGIAQGNDDALAWLSFAIAVRLDKLNERRAFD